MHGRHTAATSWRSESNRSRKVSHRYNFAGALDLAALTVRAARVWTPTGWGNLRSSHVAALSGGVHGRLPAPSRRRAGTPSSSRTSPSLGVHPATPPSRGATDSFGRTTFALSPVDEYTVLRSAVGRTTMHTRSAGVSTKDQTVGCRSTRASRPVALRSAPRSSAASVREPRRTPWTM
jgi:hypothetical protein